MIRKFVPAAWVVWISAAGLLISVGCGSGTTSNPEPATANETPQAAAEHGHDHDHGQSESGESDDPLAGLSAEDRKLAVAQKVCPVGGGNLGDMGTPVKVEHEGNVVFLCCEHCRDPFKEDPAKFLAKLEKPADGETDPAAPEPTTP